MTQPVYVANDPAAYEQQMGRWSRRLAPLLIKFARIGEPARVLDLGCGTGSLASALAEAAPGAMVTGVDLSEAYLAHARSRSADPRLRFEQGDATALTYPDGSFDAVLSLLVLNFVPKAELAVREMARVVRPGGTVAAAVWDFRGGFTFLRLLMDTAAIVDPDGEAFRARHCSYPLTGPGELAAAWRAAGLREVEQVSLTIRTEFASFADYFEPWLAGQGTVGAYVASRTAEQRARLARHLELAYRAGGEDGPRSFAATAWAVRGVR
ncbi:class I SAM-dependent methyltransferase [Geminicoccus roseus]|uniref:class I SAM-dependent methyltransferase n=1 Tax=Geminicoccus roseus TaxID=404900 RepID=UPI00041B70D1|nr:class I SAM-dependent methyltransferase [Geminicoccus roseus]